MKFKTLFFLSILTFLGEACQEGGTEGEEYQDSITYIYHSQEVREKIKKEEKKAEKTRETRIAKGDTIALKPEQLKDFLPKTFYGFKPDGDFIGTPYHLSGQSYANAEQDYVKKDTHIRITLMDYNGKEAQFAQETAYFASGIRMDDRQVIAGSITFPGNYQGWEVFEKRTHRAELYLALSDRILLKIIADKQTDTEYIKTIALKMDLKGLSTF